VRKRVLDSVCLAVLCTILTLGLWPFHTPPNDVTWLQDRNGLRFGEYGVVISSATSAMPHAAAEAQAGSIEIWVQPARMWDSGTFLAFYVPENLYRFSLRQSQTDLRLQGEDDREPATTSSIYVDDVFQGKGPTFLTVTSGAGGVAVYVDGILANRPERLRLPVNSFAGRIVLGGSPGQEDGWKGRLLGFAIYQRALTPPQVERHSQSWKATGSPEIAAEDGPSAIYLFDEHAGSVIHSRAETGTDLSIPGKFVVPDQIFLEPFWREFSMSRDYWSAALKNVVGFVPLGLSFYASLSVVRRVKRAALLTILLGTLVSITIEVLQADLPTRDSGMTDIFTNTLGTWAGVVLFRNWLVQAIFQKALRLLPG